MQRIEPVRMWVRAFAVAVIGVGAEPAFAGDDTIPVWIFLQDKPADAVEVELSPRARARLQRAGVAPSTADRRIADTDVAAIAARVTRVRVQSRWLNAVSVEATAAQLDALMQWPRIRAIKPVAIGRGGGVVAKSPAPRRPPRAGASGIDYGPSYDQLQLLQVPELHALGLSGRGVLIAHFDTGYDMLAHSSLLGARITASWDFVDDDPDVAVDPRSGDDGTHGIYTLSVVAGNRPGALVGSAYGASYALARTERSSVETAAEEDSWIAALEWADALGADVVSSSLRFLENRGGTGYTWRDMNGRTARVTRAADLAAQRGLLVVNGAGNEGEQRYRNTLIAPADGVHVLAVGAIGFDGLRARFSSCGPTTDKPPRLKPDLMAPGDFVFCADPFAFDSYAQVSGTSLSTPLVAGIVALLLEAYPEATPLQVVAAMRATASRATSPDRRMGWGIVRALAAHAFLATSTDFLAARTPRFALAVDNPWRSSGMVRWMLPEPAAVTLRVYDVRGRSVRTLVDATQPARAHAIAWDGTDDAGRELANGIYFVRLQATTTLGAERSTTRKMTLAR